MSRQSKAIKKKVEAKQFSKIRMDGGHGPSQTTPKHGKKKSKWELKGVARMDAMGFGAKSAKTKSQRAS